MDDNDWPQNTGGGENTAFVQENGAINELPGSPDSFAAPQGADNDYYFAGVYTTVIPGNGEYEPIGVVSFDEEAAERAFAGADNDLRYHFNLPDTLKPTNLLSVTFDVFNLDEGKPDTRYGIEVWVNGVKVQDEIVVRPAQIDVDYTTPQFTLESVNAEVGPGADNIVSLRGINYNNDGGGAWMGIDYVQLNLEAERIPPAVLPWSVGIDDDGWPVGNGGGTNATFVQGNGVVNDLPGSPNSPEVDQQADNDYYFAGSYTNVVLTNSYTPVGTVSVNEEAAERGFSGNDNELRYHFNLPNTLKPSDNLAVTFDASSLDTTASDARWGVEVYFNGVRVQPEVMIRAAQLDKPITTPQFTLSSVNARVGPGHDNVITLKGISYAAAGGGNSLGIDFVALKPVAAPIPPPVLPLAVGMNDNAQPAGNGGGVNTSFVQENGSTNALPGNPASPETNQQADDDYYFAGVYSTVIPGNGTYDPVGEVHVNEEAAERAFAGVDNFLRYHFNLPANLQPTNELSISFDAMSLQDDQANPRYGVEVYFNGVKVQDEIVIGLDQLNQTYNTPPFTLASVNAQPGPGFDNIITLKGINYNADGGGNWMGIDFVQLNPVLPPPFPWSVGKDDNAHPAGNGGGPNATFVQEAGINALPGNPANPEVNQQADDDYYFAGEYTTIIPANGEYEPVGTVLVNEEAAERAFAGSDNDLRYHFNLPSTLKPADILVLSFDFLSLDNSGGDPHYGVEAYVNGVLVMPEAIVYPENFDMDYTATFTLESVGAVAGTGADNIVHLKGINYNFEGGGNWMGIDYVQLDPMPTNPKFPFSIGSDDDGWPLGDGGEANASFVQENGSVNELPGSPRSPETAQQADNDYYLAGVYTNVIDENGAYEPVGIVARNEEAAERAFAGADTDLRYHFNLPSTLKPTNLLSISFDAFNLDEGGENPRFGIEVYVNNFLVQPEIIITTNELDVEYTTTNFTLASVNAQVGPGYDNIITLRGINYSADGGGNWMGIDYVKLNDPTADPTGPTFLAPTLSGGQITLNWTGSGTLEWAPAITGPWTAVTPAPNPPFSENVALTEDRFYRLRR